MTHLHVRLVGFLLPISALFLTGCGFLNYNNRYTATETLTRTFHLPGTPQITVDTFNGQVDVLTGSGAVRAKVTKRAGGPTIEAAEEDLDNMEVTFTEEANTLRIVARSIDSKSFANRGCSVELTVPDGTIVNLKSKNGNINTAGLLGSVTAESSNGSMEVKGSRGKIHLTSSNGSLTVEGGDELDLKTSNGHINIKSIKPKVTARTSNGRIQFTGQPAAGDHLFQTSNGRITLTMPADASFQIDAETSNGRINNEFGVITPAKNRSKRSLKGKVGDNPQATLKLRSSNGNIELKQGRYMGTAEIEIP